MAPSTLHNVPMFVPPVGSNKSSTTVGKVKDSGKVVPYRTSHHHHARRRSFSEMDQDLARFANGDGHCKSLPTQQGDQPIHQDKKVRRSDELPTPPEDHEDGRQEAAKPKVEDKGEEEAEERAASQRTILPPSRPYHLPTRMQTHIPDGQVTWLLRRFATARASRRARPIPTDLPPTPPESPAT